MVMRSLRARSLLQYVSQSNGSIYRNARPAIGNGYCSSCDKGEEKKPSVVEILMKAEEARLRQVEEAKVKQAEEVKIKQSQEAKPVGDAEEAKLKQEAEKVKPDEGAEKAKLEQEAEEAKVEKVHKVRQKEAEKGKLKKAERKALIAAEEAKHRQDVAEGRQTPAVKPKLDTTKSDLPIPPADHRQIGVEQDLFLTSKYSPGSPLFLPNGSRIFNKLVSFLRAQYRQFGFEEVITPTIYKKSLWEKSGHLQNYAEDMFTVTGRGASGEKEGRELEEDESYGLKPMNCPGHCLMFGSQRRSFRDLPIRYADFSPLHRNEISGALSGLTRVRRFHQDDGHIFCRPSQVGPEIARTLQFVELVYKTFKLGPYRLVLSSRPKDHFIGTVEEWDRAESTLRDVLDKSKQEWSLNEGDGAFYGPKIDIVLKDSDGKEHQTATIQLDFQLPKRFELHYDAPAPELEQQGLTTSDPELLSKSGPVQPVMIHRAVLGSLERFFALVTENYAGRWPLWLNPHQVAVITVNDTAEMLKYADWAVDTLKYDKKERHRLTSNAPGSMYHVNLDIEADTRPISVGKKISEAKRNRTGVVVVIGKQNIETKTVDADLSSISYHDFKWKLRNVLKSNGNSLWREVSLGKASGPLGDAFKAVNIQPDNLRELLVDLVNAYHTE